MKTAPNDYILHFVSPATDPSCQDCIFGPMPHCPKKAKTAMLCAGFIRIELVHRLTGLPHDPVKIVEAYRESTQ